MREERAVGVAGEGTAVIGGAVAVEGKVDRLRRRLAVPVTPEVQGDVLVRQTVRGGVVEIGGDVGLGEGDVPELPGAAGVAGFGAAEALELFAGGRCRA